MLGGRFKKSFNIAAAGEMFAFSAKYDHAYAGIGVECFKHQTQLIALRHVDDVEWRTVEDDVSALFFGVDFYAEAV